MGFIDFFAKYIKPAKLRGTGCLNPHPTGWINPVIGAIRQLDVNLWVVKGPGGYLLFDTGYRQCADTVKPSLQELGVALDQIRGVFLTHADVDHAGGLVGGLGRQLPAFVQCPIYVLAAEAKMLAGRQIRFRKGPLRLNNPLCYDGPKQFLAPGQELLAAGLKVRAIATPGHTPGHTCYLVSGGQIEAKTGGELLISGDCMAFNQSGGFGFFKMFNLDTKLNLHSLTTLREELSGRKIGAVLSGHSGCYQGDRIFAHIDQVASGTREKPFDPRAPKDVFAS